MSYHSRSSSEIESTSLREILPKYLDTFQKDFVFCDVKDMVKYIFTDEEMRLIVGQTDEKKQILQLFWVLLDNEKLIPTFLKAIEPWYSWLSKMVFGEQDTSKDTEQYVNAVRVLRSNYQKHLDLNVHRMEFYWLIRSALLKLKPYSFLLLSGELGIGKKWLFVDVCSDYTVMKAMGYNIFKLDVNYCNSREDDFRALQQLRLLIGEDESWRSSSEFDGVDNKILHLQQYIRERLKHDKYKECLLVLCGVRNSKTWRNFNLGCKVLIITRNKQIMNSLSESNSKHIPIDRGLTETEFNQLFEKILQPIGIKLEHRPDASEIFRQIGGQPCLLSIIANNLKLNKQRNWNDWKNNVQSLHITGNKFKAIVELSLRVLQPDEMELYKRLAIFPHSIKIPIKLIAFIWNMTESSAEYVLSKFDKHSILNRKYMADESVGYVLPYIYRSYLESDQDIDHTTLHQNVVNYYKINEALEERRDIDLLPSNNDYYFYHCIGYHLKKSGYLHLFPKLFFDFGFLGEKLRSDGFPNTIGDLKHFSMEITSGDPYKNRKLSEIIAFLPSTEGALMVSKDTYLLQCALMADGLVKEEAMRQASRFEDKIFFKEMGHFHQSRQTVSLPNKPKLIKALDPDICCIALDTKDILLIDMSLDYNNGPVYLTGNEFEICQMELILHENYILTLDVKGTLKVWSLKEDRRRSACRKRSSRTKVNPLNLTQSPEMSKRKCKQVIEKLARGTIKVFHVESYREDVDLHLAFSNGDVCIYSWNIKREQFEIKSLPILPTKVANITYLSKILGLYYMVLNSAGHIFFFYLADGSRTLHSFKWPETLNLVYVGEYYRNSKTHIMFVFRDKVMRLSFTNKRFVFLDGDLEVVYNINEHDPGNAFTCARLSRDGCYLVLGTKRGLIVFNTEKKLEVLRGNISECIACVDIYPLDDNIYKYIIVCGSEQSEVLNLFALRELENKTIAWSHHMVNGVNNGNDPNDPQLEPNVWLQGQKLFDLVYNNSVSLVAVDSKNRIHQLCTTNTKTWSILLPPETTTKITAITANENISFCAYENGTIFNITDEIFELTFTDKSITLLQLINENTLVASSAQANKTLVRRVGDECCRMTMEKTFDIDVFKCFTLHEKYLVLVNPKGNFMVVDLQNDFESLHYIKDVSEQLGGCDLKNNYLILATVNFKLYFYKFIIPHSCEKPIVTPIYQTDYSTYQEPDEEVTCLASSRDASLFALGCKSGRIKVYQNGPHSVRSIYCLLSHTSRIYDIKFSPNTEILVSCSEQLCFWHVPYILNNPFDSGTQPKRRSSRFSSSHSPIEEVTNIKYQTNHSGNGETSLMHQNPWANKHGPIEKPELLSCIKFVGNKAEIFFANQNFTEFNTIDNEGVYYHLCVHDICYRKHKNAINGNGHTMNADDDDEVIT